jgi:NTP pyrophosphatase (non-canonical NTP hydrolase)
MDNKDRFKPFHQIDEAAEFIRSLTYGEMMELTSELRKETGKTGTAAQIDKLADLIRCLTYGEMLELASELGKAADDSEITDKSLPTILHRWASERRHQHPTGTALMQLD